MHTLRTGEIAHVKLTLPCSVRKLPTKTAVYGTLVGLINTTDPEFGQQVVDMAMQELQECLDNGVGSGCKLLLRFLAELVQANVVPPADLLRIFNELIEAGADFERSKHNCDFYVYLVVITLPYVGHQLQVSFLPSAFLCGSMDPDGLGNTGTQSQ